MRGRAVLGSLPALALALPATAQMGGLPVRRPMPCRPWWSIPGRPGLSGAFPRS